MKFSPYLVLIIIVIGLFLSCEHSNFRPTDVPVEDTEKAFVKSNRYLVRSESEDIADFVARYKWPVETSGTGLRYWIEKEGIGPKAKYGDRVELDYQLKLLTGEVIRSSKSAGQLRFTVGKGGVEAGLEEGILLLKKGSRAKFILPSHLAFGLLGDGDRIPSRSSLVYEVEVIDIHKNR